MERQRAVDLASDLLERLTSVALGLDEDDRLDFVTNDQIEALDRLIQIAKTDSGVHIRNNHVYYGFDGNAYELIDTGINLADTSVYAYSRIDGIPL